MLDKMSHELNPCPFCGGEIKIVLRRESIVRRVIKARCGGCEMTFEHEQKFSYSPVARIALDYSFEDIWNGGLADG